MNPIKIFAGFLIVALTLFIIGVVHFDLRIKSVEIKNAELNKENQSLKLNIIDLQADTRRLRNRIGTKTERSVEVLHRTNENLERVLRDLFIPNRCDESNETIKDKISSKK